QVQIGMRSLSDVVPDAAPRPSYAWTKRVLAILLAWGGALLMFSPRCRDKWLALVAGVAPLALLACVSWFGVRNSVAIVLLAIGILAAAGATWRARNVFRRRGVLLR
ncbi:MAG TPA: hypothetical protein VJ722_03070, partial [Rhodanobacteraceae bacterium]|nr:hypothetical protein [Rhodanobacteraceae bacterium]